MALLKPHIAYELNRTFSSSQKGAFQFGSAMDPDMFEPTAETFNATSTTMNFSRAATVRNMKHRSLTLTANLSALVLRMPEEDGLFATTFIQDATGNRTIPTPTAVAADGTTAVTVTSTMITESTSANLVDTVIWRYNKSAQTVKIVSSQIGNTAI